MSKGKISLIVILLAIAGLAFLGFGKYNTIVTKEQEVAVAWSNVETQYQRRLELIPNLVNTVKGQADFEKSTLENVIKARASATQVKIDPSNLTEADLQRFQSAQSNLNSSLSRLLVTVEKYPELKTTDAYRQLSVQLEGTENRIVYARTQYNAVAQSYNTLIKTFPTVIFARILGFNAKPYFQANAGADQAPVVDFN